MARNQSILIRKLRDFLARLRYIPHTLRLVWTAAGKWFTTWVLLLLLQGVLPVATVYLSKLLVDALSEFIGSDHSISISRLLIPALGLASVMLLAELLRGASSYIRTVQSDLLKDHISGLVHRKSTEADLAFYELPEFYDHLHRAQSEASFRPVALLESLGTFVQHGITLVAMAAVLIPYGLWLPVVLFVSTLPAFYVVIHFSLRQHRWRQRTTAEERKSWYYSWLLTTGETAAEIRLFDLGDYFQAAYQKIRKHLRGEARQLAKGQAVAELLAGGLAMLVTGATMTWMVWRASQGQATLGDLAFFYQAFNQGQRMMHSLLQQVGQLYYNSLFLGNLFEFLSLQPEVVDMPEAESPPPTLQTGIRFEQVTFRYPGNGRAALDRFNLELPAGKFVALVGPNGAGKSTIVKLLCRFYDPESGRITLDNRDLRELRLDSLRRYATVLFQSPVRYNATVADNIAFGSMDAAPSRDQVQEAAEAAGADAFIRKLPDQYDQLLGKWFETGTELSVGEWQRIALARAFMRQSPILILDEPTSAMDPWAEIDWLQRFRKLAVGHTALVITHRFTTAMHADIIHVLSDGQVVESGSHHQLLGLGARYATSWRQQMQTGGHLSDFRNS